MEKILVTGCAGFIGMNLCKRLLDEGLEVIGLDNFNDYYPVALKRHRIDILKKYENFQLHTCSLENAESVERLFENQSFNCVVNLAAQAGVRYSIQNPRAYIDSNIAGFLNILECCRHSNVPHLIFASSSSVYGSNEKVPFSEQDNVDHPMSLYAATKKSNELMAHSYSSLYNLPVTGLRFFTVYGPWGRPDMAYFLFAEAINSGYPIKVFNNGKMQRDFTYISDVVEAVLRLIRKGAPEADSHWDRHRADPAASYAPYRIFNIGNNRPVQLEYMISLMEEYMGKKALRQYLPMQQGDVPATYADVDALMEYADFNPKVTIEEGLQKFVNWFKEYKCV